MASGLSETSIYNMVLDRLAEESILGPTDDKAVARWLNRNYPVQRDLLLQKHPWNFAVKRAALAADVETPAFEWAYQYSCPTDCLRVLPITRDGRRESAQISYVVEGSKILTNKSAPLYIRYIARIDNTAFFTPMFANLLAQVLAANAAHWLTGKANFAKFLNDSLPGIIADAQLIDSLEGTPEPPDDGDILESR